ncbi:MAG: peptidoglycan bridge formation glycyltransferase FemA/FemB family protein [Candidatus Sulfotelmatobacter sp.]
MSCVATVEATEARKPDSRPSSVHCIEPLQDCRWDAFVQKHPRASIFHSRAWLTALSRSYGYKPVAYTTSPANRELENGVVFCQVDSWLTGRRLVSLPFSDHCEPLVDTPSDLAAISLALEEASRRGQWRYIELRPLKPVAVLTSLQQVTVPYTFHQLDLRPDLETLFRNCHKNSTQRKILRAEREGLQYREGSTAELLNCFYRLHTLTRKRHNRPPQPRKWFVNLMDCFGENLKIRVACKNDRPVAAVLTIRYKDTMVYKYGGSDSRYNKLGGMHLLLWRAIQEAKAVGLGFVDFGRTDEDQQGLVTFKKRWGSEQSILTYSRYGLTCDTGHIFESYFLNRKSAVARRLLTRMPGFTLLGRALYRHVG